MAFYFFQLDFLGYASVMVYEPNVAMRWFEFGLAVYGILALIALWAIEMKQLRKPRTLRKLTPQERLSLGVRLQ
jgi:hypothetical protein